jgi:hypothetical protein
MPRHLHYGPARVPSRESPEAAVEALLERDLSACEIDFEGRFWMDYEFAERFGELAREHAGVVTLSMGTTSDLEAAVTAGTTMVRIGTALFGPRPVKGKA